MDDVLEKETDEKCPEKDLIQRIDHNDCCTVGVVEVAEDDWRRFLTRVRMTMLETFVTVVHVVTLSGVDDDHQEHLGDVQMSKRQVCLVFVTIVVV